MCSVRKIKDTFFSLSTGVWVWMKWQKLCENFLHLVLSVDGHNTDFRKNWNHFVSNFRTYFCLTLYFAWQISFVCKLGIRKNAISFWKRSVFTFLATKIGILQKLLKFWKFLADFECTVFVYSWKLIFMLVSIKFVHITAKFAHFSLNNKGGCCVIRWFYLMTAPSSDVADENMADASPSLHHIK